MLNNQPFYNETIRNVVLAFGSIFNEISIRRIDAQGTTIKTIRVPLAYGSKEKWMAKLRQHPDDNEIKTEIRLPRIGFELNSIQYDPERKLSTMNRRKTGGTTATTSTVQRSQYERSPFNAYFTVHVMVKNTEDGLQILEQILPFFTPQYNVTIEDNSDLNDTTDVPIVLTNVDCQDLYEDNFDTRRALFWSLTFTAKFYLYKPTTTSKVIKKVIVDYYDALNAADNAARRIERYTVTPYPYDAVATDDYGFSETREFFDDNLLRNPDTGADEVDISSSSSSSTRDSNTSSSSYSSSSSTAESNTSSSSSSSSSSSHSSQSSSSSSSSTVASVTSSSSNSSSSTDESSSSNSSSSSSSSTLDSATSSSSSTDDATSSSSEDLND